MKALASFLLVFFVTTSGYAQQPEENKQIDTIRPELPCFNTTNLVKELREKYKEVPIVVGKALDVAQSTMSLWLDPNSGSWTLISTKRNVSCVVGHGTELKIITLGNGKDI